jgi:uncharacterized protein YneF (UPF0154 family)
MELKSWQVLIVVLPTLVIGFILGFISCKYYLKKQIEETQKNFDSMGKDQIKDMLSAFGKSPSKEQVNRIVNTMENIKKKKSLKEKKPTKVKKRKK